MLLGILSDTHNRLDAMIAAMRILQASGAEFFIHCGDIGDEAIIDQLAGHPAAFVWGNNDFDRARLAKYANSLGIRCLDSFGDLELDNKRFAITHGDDGRLLKRLLLQQQHDYLLLGHTHVKRDERVGKLRLINPGALYRASIKTVAMLDTRSDELRFLEVSV